MTNDTKKVLVLNDLKSSQIEQAIFILRDNFPCSETDAVTEAEKIVNSYLGELYLVNEGKKHFFNKAIFWVAVCVGFAGLLLAYILH